MHYQKLPHIPLSMRVTDTIVYIITNNPRKKMKKKREKIASDKKSVIHLFQQNNKPLIFNTVPPPFLCIKQHKTPETHKPARSVALGNQRISALVHRSDKRFKCSSVKRYTRKRENQFNYGAKRSTRAPARSASLEHQNTISSSKP